MSVSTTKETMLYCPKCQQTYEEGTQRFCTNEGNRLLPMPSAAKSANQSSSVFSNLLGKISSTDDLDKKLSSTPRFTKIAPLPPLPKSFASPSKPPVIRPKQTELKPKPEVQPLPQKPLPRIIKLNDIPASQATLGNRQTNPTGRPAVTRANPNALLEQTVKGRYSIVEKIGEDDSSISYLAIDKLAADKKVVVRVLMEEDTNDDFTNQIFAEERISLSLINHPNIARILDSGELSEGKPFIVTEYAEGKSVGARLKQTGQFNGLRTARIIRQVAYALSEVHQNGVLHRNLKPENIILSVSEIGNEQVKVTNFDVSKSSLISKNLNYKAPEQVSGNLASYASDIYSLAVIAYQMLTNRLPFNASSAETLQAAQKAGLKIHPTNLRLDLPPLVDEILEKGLAFNPLERYPKARDFGDALFNALTTVAPWEKHIKNDEIELIADKTEVEQSEVVETAPVILIPETAKETPEVEISPLKSDIHISPGIAFGKDEEELEIADAQSTEELAWEKRSPEIPKVASSSRTWLAILGLAVLFIAIWGLWQYMLSRPTETVVVPKATEKADVAATSEKTPVSPLEDIEIPPVPRTISQPANTTYFQNNKENLKGDTAKNFLGFSLYYPNDWKQNVIKEVKEKGVRGKFLDISKNAPNNLPIEQMLVSYYDSKGTFKADRELFPALVKETSEYLKKNDLPTYELISQGEKTINNGWRVYEIAFQGETKTSGGEQVMIWGKRLWIPTTRVGMKNGYAITMIATSLSPEVKSAEDVGVKGELAAILATFEPNLNF